MTPLRVPVPVERGLEAMLALRRARIADGDRVIGWKLGFGAPAAMEKFATDRPLVGFLTESRLIADGSEVSLDGWAAPAFEPEVAVHLGRDIDPGDSAERVRAAIAGLSAAIELADVDPPPVDPESILGGNIFHRHVVLGPVDEGRTNATGMGARVLRNGAEAAATDNVHALPGDPLELLSLTAELLDSAGERLRAGDVIITGSVVPPLQITAGERIEVEMGELGSLSVTTT